MMFKIGDEIKFKAIYAPGGAYIVLAAGGRRALGRTFRRARPGS